jgi:hypothetical protein
VKLKFVKLYRAITINGTARESITADAFIDLTFIHELNMIELIDKRKIYILIPITNIEHFMPVEKDYVEFTTLCEIENMRFVQLPPEEPAQETLETKKPRRKVNVQPN